MSDWYGPSIYSGEEPLDYIDNIHKQLDLNSQLSTQLINKFPEIRKGDTYVPYIHQRSKFNSKDVAFIQNLLIDKQKEFLQLANTPQKVITYGMLLLDYECQFDLNTYNLLKKSSKSVMDYLNASNEKFIPMKRDRLDMNREFFEKLKEVRLTKVKENTEPEKELSALNELSTNKTEITTEDEQSSQKKTLSLKSNTLPLVEKVLHNSEHELVNSFEKIENKDSVMDSNPNENEQKQKPKRKSTPKKQTSDKNDEAKDIPKVKKPRKPKEVKESAE